MAHGSYRPLKSTNDFLCSSTLKYANCLALPCPQGIWQLTRLSMGAQWAVLPLSGFSTSNTSIHSLVSPPSPPMFNIFPPWTWKDVLFSVIDYLFI
jgi:hypothetical protein